jgi:hypothetical protein
MTASPSELDSLRLRAAKTSLRVHKARHYYKTKPGSPVELADHEDNLNALQDLRTALEAHLKELTNAATQRD